MGARTPYPALIGKIASTYQLDPDLLEAQVIVESSGDPTAFRYEPAFFKHYIVGNGLAKGLHFGPLAACSFGLLQILLETALEDGFEGRPEDLFQPQIGLDCGARRLRKLRDLAGGNPHAMLAAYNGGPALLHLPSVQWPAGPRRYVQWVTHLASEFPSVTPPATA